MQYNVYVKKTFTCKHQLFLVERKDLRMFINVVLHVMTPIPVDEPTQHTLILDLKLCCFV